MAAQLTQFNYQAKLSSAAGTPLQGTHTLFLSLWDGGTSSVAGSGTQVYSETANVNASSGIINHAIGTGNYLPGPALANSVFSSSNDIFLQVAVDSQPNVVLPRSRLEPVPFAMNSTSASNGIPSGFLIAGPTTMAPQGFTFTGKLMSPGWQERAPILTPRSGAVSALVGTNIYVLGGAAASGISAKVEVYDTIANTWTTAPQLLTNRNSAVGGVIGGFIYLAGGVVTLSSVDTTIGYNISTGQGSNLQTMGAVHSAASGAVYNDKLYVFGGANTYTACEVYTPGTNMWAPIASMPTFGRASAACAVVNGKAYVIGGRQGDGLLTITGKNEVYDFTFNTWTSRASIPNVHGVDATAAAIGTKIYVIGGHVDPDDVPTVQVYDTISDTWAFGVYLTTPRSADNAISLNGQIYLLGSQGQSLVFDPVNYYLHSKN